VSPRTFAALAITAALCISSIAHSQVSHHTDRGIHPQSQFIFEPGSYPAIIQSPNGDLDMTHNRHRTAIKHVHLALAQIPQH
jgi:hypothetical protein